MATRVAIALAVLVAIPVPLWAGALPLEPRLVDLPAALRSLSVLSALCGLTALSATLVLGARIWFLEPLLGGVDTMQRAHRATAVAAVALLAAHGTLLVASLVLISPESLLALLPPNASWQVLVGILALAVIAPGAVAGLRGLRYDRLVPVMRALGAAALLAGLHAFATPGIKSASLPLTLYLGGLAALGAAAFAYRSLASDLLVPRRDYLVTAVRRLDESVTEITLQPVGRPMWFSPGQFVYVALEAPGLRGELHPFTITSSPEDRELRLVIKALGDWTGKVRDLAVGTRAKVEGPYGRLSCRKIANPKQVWVAGGVGITPFLSMARSLDSDRYEVDLYYCMERSDQAYYLDELYTIADRDMRVRVTPIRRDSLGRLTAEDIEGASHVVAQKDILIWGPPAMIDNLTRQLRRIGVPRERIHTERFLYA